MKTRNYQEHEVIKSLSQKRDLILNVGTKNIQMFYGIRSVGDVGIKSKGKIDFLTKYCGWTRTYVNTNNP